MTKATTIIALTCLLVVGMAAATILGRNSVPAAGGEITSALPEIRNPVSNKETKQDKLAVVATMALAAFDPPQPALAPGESLRQAFASTVPSDIEVSKIATAPAGMPQAPSKAKAAVRPPVQKSYALLSDAQIAGIKQRLRLSSDQESYWPAVETALRAVARRIHATRQADPNATGAPIDPDAAEVQQLKSAAMPLLFQLREDQKREVRSLARIIGLEKVASMI